jgi:hypothetical protein
MHANKSLIADARRRYNGKSAGQQAYLEQVIQAWLAACQLSRGPDQSRAAYWQRKAEYLANELEAMAGRKFAESVR